MFVVYLFRLFLSLSIFLCDLLIGTGTKSGDVNGHRWAFLLPLSSAGGSASGVGRSGAGAGCFSILRRTKGLPPGAWVGLPPPVPWAGRTTPRKQLKGARARWRAASRSTNKRPSFGGHGEVCLVLGEGVRGWPGLPLACDRERLNSSYWAISGSAAEPRSVGLPRGTDTCVSCPAVGWQEHSWATVERSKNQVTGPVQGLCRTEVGAPPSQGSDRCDSWQLSRRGGMLPAWGWIPEIPEKHCCAKLLLLKGSVSRKSSCSTILLMSFGQLTF